MPTDNSSSIYGRHKKNLTKSQINKLKSIYSGYQQTTADEMREAYLQARKAEMRNASLASSMGLGSGYTARQNAATNAEISKYGEQLNRQADAEFESKAVVPMVNQTIKAKNEAARKAYERKKKAAYQAYLNSLKNANQPKQQSRLTKKERDELKYYRYGHQYMVDALMPGITAYPNAQSPRRQPIPVKIPVSIPIPGITANQNAPKTAQTTNPRNNTHNRDKAYQYAQDWVDEAGGTPRPKTKRDRERAKANRYAQEWMGNASSSSSRTLNNGTAVNPRFDVSPKAPVILPPEKIKEVDAMVKDIRPDDVPQFKLDYLNGINQYANLLQGLNDAYKPVGEMQNLINQYQQLAQDVGNPRLSTAQRKQAAVMAQEIERQYRDAYSAYNANKAGLEYLQERVEKAYGMLQINRAVLSRLGIEMTEDDIASDTNWVQYHDTIPVTPEQMYLDAVKIIDESDDLSKEFIKRAKTQSAVLFGYGDESGNYNNALGESIVPDEERKLVLESEFETWARENGFGWVLDEVAKKIRNSNQYGNLADAIKDVLSQKETSEWQYFEEKNVRRVLSRFDELDDNEKATVMSEGANQTGIDLDKWDDIHAAWENVSNYKFDTDENGQVHAVWKKTGNILKDNAINRNAGNYVGGNIVAGQIEKKLGLPSRYLNTNTLAIMTKEDAAFLNYCYGMGDKETARQYIYQLAELANQLVGKEKADKIADLPWGIRFARESMDQFSYGVSSFHTGLADVFADHRVPTTVKEVKSSEITENQRERGWGGFADIYNPALVSAGNMAPSIAIGMAGGAAAGALANTAAGASTLGALATEGLSHAGTISMGLSAGGKAKQEALRMGYGKDAANVYGVINGISETCLQELMGGVVTLGQPQWLEALGDSLLNSVKNPVARVMIRQALNAASETTEEVMQDILDPVFKGVSLNEKYLNDHPDAKQLLNTALSTVISTLLMNGMGGDVLNNAKTETAVQRLSESYGLSVADARFMLNTYSDLMSRKGGDLNIDDYNKYNELAAVIESNLPSDVIDAIQRGETDLISFGTSRLGARSTKLNTEISKLAEGKSEVFDATDHTEEYKGMTPEQERAARLNGKPTGKIGNMFYSTTDGKAFDTKNMNLTQKLQFVMAQKIAKAFPNLQVVLHDRLPLSEGRYATAEDGKRTVHLALDADNALSVVGSHELIHALQSAMGKDAFVKNVGNYIKAAYSASKITSIQSDIISNYEGFDNSLLSDEMPTALKTDKERQEWQAKKDEFEDEVYAHLGEKLFTDDSFLDKIIRDTDPANQNVKAKLLNAMRDIVDRVSRAMEGDNIAIDPKLNRLQKKLTKAFAELNKETVDNRDEARYNESDTIAKEDKTNGREATEEGGRVYSEDFRRVHDTSEGLSEQDISEFHSGNREIEASERERMAKVFRAEIQSAIRGRRIDARPYLNPDNGNEFNVVEGIDGDTFHDIFSIVQKYLFRGDQVDVHDAEFYRDCDCYISDDGLSGFAIEKSGNGVSGFSLSKKRGFFKATAPIFKQKVKFTDCFQTAKQNLPAYYEALFGFKTASVLDFNYDILAADRGTDYADYFVKTYGESPVHFMVNPALANTQDITERHFDKTDWDGAYNYQQSFFANNKTEASERFRNRDASDERYMELAEKYRDGTATEDESVELGKMVLEKAKKAGYVIRGMHGTTKLFWIFDRSKGFAGGNWGKGTYFSTSRADAKYNYASSSGPDLMVRINHLADQLEWEDAWENASWEERKQEARRRLDGQQNRIINAALRIQNPLVLGVGTDHGMNDELGDLDETYFYSYADEETYELKGPIWDFVDALNEELYDNYDIPTRVIEEIRSELIDALSNEGDFEDLILSAVEIEDIARKVLYQHDIPDENGNLAPGEALRAAFERMGFDGIIDNNVFAKFVGMQGLYPNTSHIIVFDSSQAKQVDPVTYDNNGNIIPLSQRFDNTKRDIRYRMRGFEENMSPIAASVDTKAIKKAVKDGTATTRDGRSVRVTYDPDGVGYTVAVTDNGNTYTRHSKANPDLKGADVERTAAVLLMNVAAGRPNSKGGSPTAVYFEKGENPKRDINVPRYDKDKRHVGRFMRTIAEALNSEEMANEMVDKAIEGAASYDVIHNKPAIEYATHLVADDMVEAQNRWNEAVTSAKIPTPNDIAVGSKLLHEASEAGNAEEALRLSVELTTALRRAGQAVQAGRLLKQMGPAGNLFYVTRAVAQLNRDLEKMAARYRLTLNKDLVDKLLHAQTDEEIEAARDALIKDIANQVKPSLADSLNAWRYLAMLGNFRTHIRNIMGNMAFVPAVMLKNVNATALEQVFVKKQNRTKSLVWGKQYSDFARSDWKNSVKPSFAGQGNKYSDVYGITNEIEQQRRKFPKWMKAVEAMSRANGKALEGEDMLFKGMYYRTSLASYLSAQKVDIGKLKRALQLQTTTMLAEDSEAAHLVEVYEKARDYAIREANRNTYNDVNAFAQALAKFSRNLKKSDNLLAKGGHVLLEGAVPFKNTPANIVQRAVEYSPAGFLKTITQNSVDLHKRRISANEYIDNVAQGLAGTEVMALGYLLGSLGILTGGYGSDKDDKDEKRKGHQSYALEIGGYSYTLDWLAPVCIPLFTGVEIHRLAKGDGLDGESAWKAIGNAMTSMLEPIINMSMLEGVQNSFTTIKYSDNELGDLGIALASSYLGQFVPTIFGQVARSLDKYTRRTYTDKDSPMPRLVDKFWQSIVKKLPVINKNLMPYINEWGEYETEDRGWLRVIENMFSPGYISKIKETAPDSVIAEVIGSTEISDKLRNSLYPTAANNSFSYGGETYNLSKDEYEQYAVAKGRLAAALITALGDSAAYSSLTDFEKATAIADAYEYANVLAKSVVLDMRLGDEAPSIEGIEKWVGYANEYAESISNSPTALADYVAIRTRLSQMKAGGWARFGNIEDYTYTDKNGNAKVKWADMKWDYLMSLDLTPEERLFIADANGIQTDSYAEAIALQESTGLKPDAYNEALGVWEDYTRERDQKKKALSEEEYSAWINENASRFKDYLNTNDKLNGQQKFALLSNIGDSAAWSEKADNLKNKYGVDYETTWKAAYAYSKLSATDDSKKSAQYVDWLDKNTKLTGQQKFEMVGAFGNGSAILTKANAFATGSGDPKYGDVANYGKPSYDALWEAHSKYALGERGYEFQSWLDKKSGLSELQKFACIEFANSQSQWIEKARNVNTHMGISYKTLWKIKLYWSGESGTGKKERIKKYCRSLGLTDSQITDLYDKYKFLS